jgi:hypothetical protein
MTLYQVLLMTAAGSLQEKRELDCDHDDAVIDYAGRIDHVHEIHVFEGERLVARFPSEKLIQSPFDF